MLPQYLKNHIGDISVETTDLFVFLGYFGLSLYVGGISYISAFNNYVGYEIRDDNGIIPTSIMFLNALGIGSWVFIIAIIFSIFLSVIFILSKFFFRFYFGFIITLSLLAIVLLFVVFLGSYRGSSGARDIFDIEKTTLPILKLKTNNHDFQNGDYRLLHDTDDYLFLVQPGISDSIKQIHVIQKKQIINYEVIVK